MNEKKHPQQQNAKRNEVISFGIYFSLTFIERRTRNNKSAATSEIDRWYGSP